MRSTAAALRSDPKLIRIAAALRDAFGTRLVSALLFGSRARGNHRPDSDYDVAVFLDGYDQTCDRETLDRIRQEMGEEVWTLQFWPMPPGGLAERTTLTFNIRNDAVPLPGFARPEVAAPPLAPDEGPMKPETANLLDKAAERLEKAKIILAADVADSAGREAYTAALYAARAFIFEERNVAPKTHEGSRSLFHELAFRSKRLPEEFASVLTDGYAIKFIVDYSGEDVQPKKPAEYVERAARFIEAVRQLVAA